MTRQVALIGVPSGAGACGVGQHEAPAELRAVGLVERLADAGIAVTDLGDAPSWPWRPDRTNRRAQNLGAVVEQVRTTATRSRCRFDSPWSSAAIARSGSARSPARARRSALSGSCTSTSTRT